MDTSSNQDRLTTLGDYAAGRLGTRQAIEKLGLHDYADLIIALAQHKLDLPKWADTPRHEANVARARMILQPQLRRDH
jgi:hypothetical protein